MPDNTKIKKLIENSFLDPEEKRYLSQYIDLKGADVRFFNMFNDYLVEATKKRGEDYKKMVSKIDKVEAALDDQITKEKARIEEELESDKNWDKYYSSLDKLGEKYQKELQGALSEILSGN